MGDATASIIRHSSTMQVLRIRTVEFSLPDDRQVTPRRPNLFLPNEQVLETARIELVHGG